MAVQDAIFAPGKERGNKIAALAATTSSTEQSLGSDVIFAINSPVDIHIRFGVTGMGAATVADFRIPAEATLTFQTGQAFTHIRVFNSDASATDVYILPLSKF